jgi:catechol 2,3-dioxygenase-like lactoylglutathione lyase family enzyme
LYIPKIINHIALSVADLNSAIKWYKEVFWFSVINGPVEIVVDDSPLGIAAKDIHGPKLKKCELYG